MNTKKTKDRTNPEKGGKVKRRSSVRKRVLISVLLVIGAIVLLLVGLNIYGRQPFDPSGYDTVDFNPEDLKPGKNTVEYLSNGSRISAFLFIPEDYVEGEKRPAIVITPPNSGVKEQTAGIYAEELSKKGFVTLAFDPRGFGDSGGHPLLVDPLRQVVDARNSIDFISSLEQVDADNIFNMGLCVGSGISAYETSTDSRIKAQAMVSPLLGFGDMEVELPIPADLIYIISGLAKVQYAITGNDIEFGPMCPGVMSHERVLPMRPSSLTPKLG
jgi:alpha/beta superfamily hydrolase